MCELCNREDNSECNRNISLKRTREKFIWQILLWEPLGLFSKRWHVEDLSEYVTHTHAHIHTLLHRTNWYITSKRGTFEKRSLFDCQFSCVSAVRARGFIVHYVKVNKSFLWIYLLAYFVFRDSAIYSMKAANCLVCTIHTSVPMLMYALCTEHHLFKTDCFFSLFHLTHELQWACVVVRGIRAVNLMTSYIHLHWCGRFVVVTVSFCCCCCCFFGCKTPLH